MKKHNIVTGIIFIVVLAGFVSCKRDFALKDPTSTTTGTAMLRIIDASPNFRNIFGLADSFNVFVNGSKITGYTPGTSVVMTYNNNFPTASSGFGYVSVPAGTQPIKLSVAGVVNPDSLPIQTFTKTLLADKMYTLLITDSINSTRDSSQMFVQDSYQQPTVGYYNFRFIHAVWNDTVGKTIDLWSTRTNRYLATGIKPGAITGFGQLPFNATYTDTLIIRRSVTGFPLDTLPTINYINQRTYTVYYKGDGNIRYDLKSAGPLKARHMAIYVHQ